ARVPRGEPASALTVPQQAVLRSAGGQAYAWVIGCCSPAVNVDARTGDVILRILVDNPQRQLLPGMYVRARVPRGEPASALTVPQQAVLRSAGGQAYAWVIG
ncbi:efflux transporter periplasmic adaptor subunit, partial [Stenotrophomonas maltophilia]